jgi:glucokinase
VSEGKLRDVVRIATDATGGGDAVCAQIAAALGKMRGSRRSVWRRLAGIGVSVAGPVDRARGVVLSSPNLGWVEYPLRQRLESALEKCVAVENDANCAALGEARFGAGRGCEHVVCAMIGTGIGGGLVLRRRLYGGACNVAGEIGHMTIVPGGPDCRCGNSGCLEAVASGTAIARRGRQLLVDGRSPILARIAVGDLGRVTAGEVVRAAMEGDRACTFVVEEAVAHIGIGLANVVQVVNPQAVIIGGGVVVGNPELLAMINERTRTHLTSVQRASLTIRAAELGEYSGLWGALDVISNGTAENACGSSELV